MTSIKLRSRWAVEECIATLQEQSMSKFVHYNSSRSFTKEWKPSPSGHVYWEWNKPDVQTAPIPFDHVPFMFIGHRYMACHQGMDTAKNKKDCFNLLKHRLLTQENAFFQNKIRTQGSKKVGCPALIRITRIAKFPQYKIKQKATLGRKREHSRALKQTLAEDLSLVYWEEIFYLCLPSNKEHVGHPVASALSQQPAPIMDERVRKKIIELSRSGVKNVRLMFSQISKFVLSEAFDDVNPSQRPELCPSQVEIRNVMRKARRDCYKYEFDPGPSSDEEVIEIPLSFVSSNEEHIDGVALRNNELKQRCFERIKSMVVLVETMKDENNLESSTQGWDSATESTSMDASYSSPASISNSFHNQVSYDFQPNLSLPVFDGTDQTIEVIVESNDDELLQNQIVDSVVEIAVHDD